MACQSRMVVTIGRKRRMRAEQEVAAVGHPLDERDAEDRAVLPHRRAARPRGGRRRGCRPRARWTGEAGVGGRRRERLRRRHGRFGPPRRRGRSPAPAAGPARSRRPRCGGRGSPPAPRRPAPRSTFRSADGPSRRATSPKRPRSSGAGAGELELDQLRSRRTAR